jgi:hypothetical protein
VDNVGNETLYTVGKIYECIDGEINADGGITLDKRGSNFKQFQQHSSAKWELVSEQTLTKEELEDGDICVLRDKRKAIVFENVIILPNGSLIRETQYDLKKYNV